MTTASSVGVDAAQMGEQGWVIVPDVFDGRALAALRDGLEVATDAARAEGQLMFREGVDPNDRSVRVLQLLGRHPSFEAMVDHPVVRALVVPVLGDRYLLSSLSANISRPGSRSMGLHNDLMAVLPEPWPAPYGVNLFICLDDMDEENGATRYVPGSHRLATSETASSMGLDDTLPLPASAGSIVAMDGRLWHTSGANRSADRPRRVLISFYVSSFIRTQYNWSTLLPTAVKDGLTASTRELLGLDDGNMGVRMAYAAFQNTKQSVDPHARHQ